LNIPDDEQNVIVTVHYYNPFHFTHQGAEWVDGSDAWLGTKWTGSASEQQVVKNDLDQAELWGIMHNMPLNLGEFGAYNKADMNSRVLWTDFVTRQAEMRNMSWAYWEFCAGFGIYDPDLSQWYDDLLNALIPPSTASKFYVTKYAKNDQILY
jgi:endoglucanase